MKELNSFVSKCLERLSLVKDRHWKSGVVNQISKSIGLIGVYNYGYWLRKLKEFETRGGEEWIVMNWILDIEKYPADFNKGAILTNKLKNYGNDRDRKEGQKDKGA